MARAMTVILLLVLVTSCFLFRIEKSAFEAPAARELIVALSSKEDILTRSLGDGYVSVAWSEGNARCEVTQKIAQSWDTIRKLSSTAQSRFREEIQIDPNLTRHAASTVLRTADERGAAGRRDPGESGGAGPRLRAHLRATRSTPSGTQEASRAR
jgi:hypothetical protein